MGASIIVAAGGILKRSLGMAFRRQAMPKGCAFEPATHRGARVASQRCHILHNGIA